MRNSKKKYHPPKLAELMLSKITSRPIRYAVMGDFEEIFFNKVEEKGFFIAYLWYWFQLVKSMPKFFMDKFYWGVVMFKNYIKISLRNLFRHKVYSFINILGLMIGLIACLIIGVYLISETSYDKFHQNLDNIYRVTTKLEFGGNPVHVASSNYPIAEELKMKYPDVDETVRLKRVYSNLVLNFEEKEFVEDEFVYADDSFFKIFSFKLISGNPETALKEPYSLILSNSLAKKIFGSINPLGKTLIVNKDSKFKITGIAEDPPINSHITFSMLASFVTLKDLVGDQYYKWTGDFQNFTYILLNKNSSLEDFEKKLPNAIEENIGDLLKRVNGKIEHILEPMNGIYLDSEIVNQFSVSGDKDYVIIFTSIGLLILLIACFNFTNISTARAITRAMEIGMRKVHGASKRQMVAQFLGESVSYAAISMILAVITIPIIWPLVYNLTGLEFDILVVNWTSISIYAILLCLSVGLISGIYPAFYLSGNKVAQILRNKIGDKKTAEIRKGLVILQIIISVCLLGSGEIIKDQLEFVNNKNLGFQKENIMAVPVSNEERRLGYKNLKSELLQHSNILSVTTCTAAPGVGAGHNVFVPEGKETSESIRLAYLNVDQDYIPTLKMEILKGRNFSERMSTDNNNSIIINETAARLLGWDDPIGKTIAELDGKETERRIIGVVKDFHFHSLQQKIEPLIIKNEKGQVREFLLRVNSANMEETIAHVENLLKDPNDPLPFNYYFLDELFASHFESVQRLTEMVNYFTLLANILAYIGLLGLVSFAAEQRTKEIGIRKTLGANLNSLTYHLSKDFIFLVSIGVVIAIPIIWFVMNYWLNDFPYKTDISITKLLLTGLVSILISTFTLFFITLKTALVNPVESLKYE